MCVNDTGRKHVIREVSNIYLTTFKQHTEIEVTSKKSVVYERREITPTVATRGASVNLA
jgi:hypothetical protein